ncbi:MAG: type II toxin-antitoxin system RelE/ParE family toxin [Bryobacteraceae bacterium]
MPKTTVLLYRDEVGSCPFLEWFNGLPAKVQDKCYIRLERLREMGYELRRPEAASCGTGSTNRGSAFEEFITASCTSSTVQSQRWSHLLVKEQVVPPKEIDRAVERKKRFVANPPAHTYQEV